MKEPITSAGDTDIVWYHLMGATCGEYLQQRITTAFPWQGPLQKGF